MKSSTISSSFETIGVGKTKPDIYLLAAEKFDVKPEEAAVFEDAVYAATTSKNAGFYTVGVKDDSNFLAWDDIVAIVDETIGDWSEML